MWRGIGAVLGGWLEGDFWIVAWFGRVAGELVVHSTEWATGAELFLDFGPVSAFSEELVGHSPKWATSSTLFPDFGPFSAFSLGASGPLDGVDHWLDAFPGFCPVSGIF